MMRKQFRLCVAVLALVTTLDQVGQGVAEPLLGNLLGGVLGGGGGGGRGGNGRGSGGLLGGLLGGGGGGGGGLLGGGVGGLVGGVVQTVDNVLDSIGLGISVGGLLSGVLGGGRQQAGRPAAGPQQQVRPSSGGLYYIENDDEIEVVRVTQNGQVSSRDRSLGNGNENIGDSKNIRLVDLSKIPSERIIMGFARGMNVSIKNPDGTVSQAPYTIPALFVLNATQADVSQLSI